MKKFVVFAMVFALSLLLVIPALAADESVDSVERIFDEADLLTVEEEENLSVILADVCARQDHDVVVFTLETLNFSNRVLIAEYYVEELLADHGFGTERGGTAILISMEERDWGIYSTDFGDEAVAVIGDAVVPYLSDGDYYGGFVKFAEETEREVIETAKAILFGSFVMSILLGFIVAFIVVTIMKGKLKTVRSCDNAREYVRQGSFELKHSRDLYLYSTVTRVAKPKNTSGANGGRSGGGGFGGGGGRAGGKF